MTRTLSIYTVARIRDDRSPAPVPDWRRDRACTDVDPEVFYPTEWATSTDPVKRAAAWAPARAICATCTVVAACLEDALGWEPGGVYYRHGLRGGLDPRERANLVRSRQRKTKREATT